MLARHFALVVLSPTVLLACAAEHYAKQPDDVPATGGDPVQVSDASAYPAGDAALPTVTADAGSWVDASPDAGAPADPRACGPGVACELDTLFRYERTTVLETVTFIDANRDGLLDVLTSYRDATGVQLELMRPDDTLAPPVTIPTSVQNLGHVVGDFDGDGISDFAAVTWSGGSWSIFRGDGQGGFKLWRSGSLGRDVWAFSSGRADTDTLDDLVFITGVLEPTRSVLLHTLSLGDGSAHYSMPIELSQYGGGTPLVVASGSQRAVLAHGAGFALWALADDGSIGASTQLEGFAEIVTPGSGDFNGDGFADLFAVLKTKTPGSARLGVWYGAVDGFTATPSISEIPGLRASDSLRPLVMDSDADGTDELLGVFLDGPRRLFNDAPGHWTEGASLGEFPFWRASTKVIAANTNGAGDWEILAHDGMGKVLANLSDLTHPLYRDEADPVTLSLGDFTADGQLDLVSTTTSTAGSMAVFENQRDGDIQWPITRSIHGGELTQMTTALAADVDGDSHPELLSHSAWSTVPELSLFDYGRDGFDKAASYPFPNNIYGPSLTIAALDVDGDGADDPIEQFSQAIGFWSGAALGTSSPSMREIVYTPNPTENQRNLMGTPPLLVNLDQDGEPEILVARQPGLWWLEHDAGELAIRGDFALDLMATRLGRLDIDDDGREDVLMLAFHYQKNDAAIYWLRANGHDLDPAKKLVLSGIVKPTAFVVADVAGDGDPELVVLDTGYTARVFLTTGTSELTASESHVTTPRDVILLGDESADLMAGDFTGDGQAELVVYISGGSTKVIDVLQNRAAE
jgi:hypothetical protein